MSGNLYGGTTPVVELTPQNFVSDGNNPPTINPEDDKTGQKYGLLKVYMPTCPHCVMMHDAMIKLGESLAGQDFATCALNIGNEENRPIAIGLRVSGVPALFFIDKQGNLKELDIKNRTVPDIANALIKQIQTAEQDE